MRTDDRPGRVGQPDVLRVPDEHRGVARAEVGLQHRLVLGLVRAGAGLPAEAGIGVVGDAGRADEQRATVLQDSSQGAGEDQNARAVPGRAAGTLDCAGDLRGREVLAQAPQADDKWKQGGEQQPGQAGGVHAPDRTRQARSVGGPLDRARGDHADGQRRGRGEPARVVTEERRGDQEEAGLDIITDRATRPYRRSRRAKISQACHRCRRSKSGNSVSRNTNSAYADCQIRKFEVRCSPDGRRKRSTSGRSGSSRKRATVRSSTRSGSSRPAAASCAATTRRRSPPRSRCPRSG